jgi:hypothetical protein
MNHRTLLGAYATATLALAGCSGSSGATPPAAAPSVSASSSAVPAAPAAPTALKVGRPYRYRDGLQITVTKFKIAKKTQINPGAYDKPHGKGILAQILVYNGSRGTIATDGSTNTIASDPQDAEGSLVIVPDLPQVVQGTSILGTAPLLPGQTRKVIAAMVTDSATRIKLTITPSSDRTPVTWVARSAT